MDKIGNLWTKYDLIRIRSKKEYKDLFEVLDQKIYLDSLLSFVDYHQKPQQ